MSVDFVALGCIFWVTKPKAVVLSVCTGVGGCLCPISSRSRLVGMACRVLMKSAAISASAADVITLRIIWAMFRTAPLLGGLTSSLERKKWPPALLLAFGSVR